MANETAVRLLHAKRIRAAAKKRREAERDAIAAARRMKAAGKSKRYKVTEYHGRRVYRDAFKVTLPFVSILVSTGE